MKQNWLLITLLGISGVCLTGALWLTVKNQVSSSDPHAILLEYDRDLVSGYKAKRNLILSILKESNIQDPAVQGILVHVPKWKAQNLEDIQMMEELNSHLDTLFSKHLQQLQGLENSRPALKKLMTELQTLDRQLAEPRTRLFSQEQTIKTERAKLWNL